MSDEIIRPGRALELPENLESFFVKLAGMLAKYLRENYDPEVPVHHYVPPEELEKEFEFQIGDVGTGFDGIIKHLEGAMKYGMRTGHIRFYNQLWAGSDVAAIISEWFLSVMNTSMYTYEVAPVFTLMEMYCVDRYLEMIGFKDGEGTFAPGGAHANMLGILCGRHFMFPEAKRGGMDFSANPVSFTSAHAHYTVQRTVSVLGMGLDGCLPVEVDEEGHMKPDVLDKMITEAVAEGKKPWMVAATAGTTVYGAYDPIRAIAEVCKKHGVWLHVDACWGGHALFSDRERHWLDGVELADSVSVTGTKCFGLPQQCAAVLVRQKGILRATNAMNADYLFHEYEEKSYDVGELTLNCGRRVDAFKLWLSWKVHGNKGMSERVEHAFDIARYMEHKIRTSDNVFEMAHHPESLNVCFWYLPKSMRGRERTEEDIAVLDKLTGRIRRHLQLEGRALTNFADVPGQPHFFRHICCNPGADADDIDFLLSELARIGDELSEKPLEEEL